MRIGDEFEFDMSLQVPAAGQSIFSTNENQAAAYNNQEDFPDYWNLQSSSDNMEVMDKFMAQFQ